MPELSLRLFGSPRVAVDGRPVAVGRRKALALLAYLAVEPAPPGRERLVSIFWPDEEPARGRAALRRMLSVLRGTFGDERIGADRDRVAVDREGLGVDVVAFRDAARRIAEHAHDDAFCSDCAARLASAVALCEGDFLSGFTLEGCPEFDEWQLFQTETLRGELGAALDRLAGWHEARGELDRAVDFARRRLALDALDEPAHVRVMRLYALAGRRAAALRQFGECARVLEAELGERPGEEATQLFETIKSGGLRPRAGARPVAPRRRLPAATTPFLGREVELADLARRFDDPACRLVTISGPGGVGKTRLAMEAAARRAAASPEEIRFVPLSRIESADLLATAIADAVGASFDSRDDMETLVAAFLRDKAMLLVLDNFEHLVARAGWLGELLEGAPELRLLVTSRERLGLRGERLVDLDGLPYPPDGTREDLESFASVRLFLDAAARARADFAPGPDDMAHVARICRLVEGLPLAVELAAAWARMLSPAEIEREILRSLDFLTASARDTDERHRSLRAVFAPSWEMLSPEERDAFARLSVLRGGFGRDAAEAVAGTSLAVLAALVDKSLVRYCEGHGGRYDVQELLRQLAAERLDERPSEAAAARDRHCAFYGAYLARLSTVGGCHAIDGVDDELENVRAGWDWAVERVMADEISRYATPMFAYYDTRGRFEEGEMAFGGAAAKLDGAATPDAATLARMLSRQGAFCAHRGRFVEARGVLARAVDLMRGLGEDAELALALNRLGIALHHSRRDDLALELLSESLAIFRAIGDRSGEARALGSLGYFAGDQRRYEDALRLMEESLAINRELGDRYQTATSLNDLGYVLLLEGNMVRARALLEESLAMRRDLEYRKGIAVTLDNLGYVALALGERERAREHLLESIEIALEIQAVPVVLDAAHGLAHLVAEAGDPETAAAVMAFVRDHPAVWPETKEDAVQRLAALPEVARASARDLGEAVRLAAAPYQNRAR